MHIDIDFFIEERWRVQQIVYEQLLFFLFGCGLSFLLLKGDRIWRRSDRPQMPALLILVISASPVDPFDDSDQFCSQCSFGSNETFTE